MAWGRKKSGGRKEPLFGLPAALADLRLSPDDRIPAAVDDDKPKKPVPRRKDEDDDVDDPPPRERKPRAAKGGAKRRAKSRGRIKIGRLVYWGAVLGLWAAIAIIGFVVWVGAHLPAIQSLEIPTRPPTIQIVGVDGSLLASRGEMAGTNVALKDLPPYLPKAFIAIEDRRFYSHYGVDPVGIARAAVTNLLHRGVSQGGSTLTQQLAKNLFLTQERTMARKLQEVELALWLERKHSKNEILELYLNRVYFGSGAYGVEAASQRYFGKSAKNVTVAEAAMLAGLVKSPSRLAPNRNPEGAEARAGIVLAAMAEGKLISAAQAKASIGHPAYNVKAERRPAWAFKPFISLPAIEGGLTPETIRQDALLDLKRWKPEHYAHAYFGAVTLTQALAMSLNTVAVRLGLEVGPKNVVRTAHRLGISSKLDANATIALGTSEVSLTELVGAYAPFANGGLGVSPHVVTKIRTAQGKVLYARPADQLGQVIEPRHVAMMNTMMQETLISGTARKAEIPGWVAAGKTGTSQDFRDAWFIGYTANLVTGVWLGNDDNSPTRKATGRGCPVELLTRFMRAAHQGVAVASLPNSQYGGVPTLAQIASQITAPTPPAP